MTDRAALRGRARRASPPRTARRRCWSTTPGIDQPPDAGTPAGEDVPLEAFTRTLDVNLAGTFNATRCSAPAMVAAGRGSIVNIGSLYASIAPEPRFYDHLPRRSSSPPPTARPRPACVHLTRYFARLWGPHGVRVNALSPGGVARGQDAEFLASTLPASRSGGWPSTADLGGPLVFLASDASRYVTGHELRVDGGFTA